MLISIDARLGVGQKMLVLVMRMSTWLGLRPVLRSTFSTAVPITSSASTIAVFMSVCGSRVWLGLIAAGR